MSDDEATHGQSSRQLVLVCHFLRKPANIGFLLCRSSIMGARARDTLGWLQFTRVVVPVKLSRGIPGGTKFPIKDKAWRADLKVCTWRESRHADE